MNNEMMKRNQAEKKKKKVTAKKVIASLPVNLPDKQEVTTMMR